VRFIVTWEKANNKTHYIRQQKWRPFIR